VTSSKKAKKKAGAKKATPSRKTSPKKKTSKAKSVKSPARKTTKKATKKKVAKKKAAKRVAKKTSKAAVKKKTVKKAAPPAGKKAGAKTASAKKVTVSSSASKAAPATPAPAVVEKPKPKRPALTTAQLLKRLPYGVGDHVVHPKYGLGEVMIVIEKQLTERKVPCFEIHFSHQDMKLTIPVEQAERSGLRLPIDKKHIDDVLKVLRGRATFDAKRRSAKRVADYQKKVRLGDPTSLAEVVRDLSRLALKKTLSYEERKILGEALRILSREVALARGHDASEALEEIEAIVNR